MRRENQTERRIMMKRPWLGMWAIPLIALLSAAGCATANGIQKARATMDEAKENGAVYKAPFEYKAAEAYLAKAVEQAEEARREADRIEIRR